MTANEASERVGQIVLARGTGNTAVYFALVRDFLLQGDAAVLVLIESLADTAVALMRARSGDQWEAVLNTALLDLSTRDTTEPAAGPDE